MMIKKSTAKGFLWILISLGVLGCADMDPVEFDVEKPLSIKKQEELNSLQKEEEIDANSDKTKTK